MLCSFDLRERDESVSIAMGTDDVSTGVMSAQWYMLSVR